ncbi:MAG: ABC transporter permease [Caulobacter sp.]
MRGFSDAGSDIQKGLKLYKTWGFLAYQDVVSRYRRSLFGPLWISAGMLTTAGALALVFSTIFRVPLTEFLPFVVAGLVVFTFIGVPFTEGGDVYLQAASTIKAYPLPFSFHIFRLAARSLIVFGHNLLVFAAVKLIFSHNLLINPQVILGLFLVSVFVAAASVVLGVVGARFKDVRLLVPYVWTIVFYLTPVIWTTKSIHDARSFIYKYNPFYYLLETVRNPLLGIYVPWNIFTVALLIDLLAVVAAVVSLAMFRKRIALWV